MSETPDQVVHSVAEKLTSPEDLRRTATVAENLARLRTGPPRPPWQPLSLDEGHPGVALLFAVLTLTDQRFRTVTHDHLAAAMPHARRADLGINGIYQGLPALAFAANIAATRPTDYGKLLSTLDQFVVARAAVLVRRESARLDTDTAGVPLASYDVISGLTGLGRYLLDRPAEHRAAVSAIGDCLARLTLPVTAHGHRIPGWWSPEGPTWDPVRHPPRGHFNLGMAHGITGPLALLSLLRLAGVPVRGTEDAAHRIASWLLSWMGTDECGPHWPAVITFDEHAAGGLDPVRPARPSWCYGTPGIARALQLAASAFDEPAWARVALDAMRAALARAESLDLWGTDVGVCHGLGGLLQITRRMADDSGDPELGRAVPSLVDRLVARFDPSAPFGFVLRTRTGAAIDRAGFLEGAAGAALALAGRIDARWDSALLVS
jgi:hypothetical protein